LQKTIKDCDDIFDPPEQVHANRETIKNIGAIVGRKKIEIESYILIFQKKKAAFTISGLFENFSVIPRTLVLTEEFLLLCDEDYSRWPSSTINKSKPNTTQFTVVSSRNVHDVIGIEIESKTTMFSIKFDSDNSPQQTDQQPWDYIAASNVEKNRYIKSLCRVWKRLFKNDLPIVERGFKSQ